MAEKVEKKKSKILKVTSSSDSSVDCDFISKLPSDLTPHIFSKLPVKSLCRFKCVSKTIRSMIQEPDFVKENRSKDPFCWEIFSEVDDQNHIIIVSINQDGTRRQRRTATFKGTLWEVRYCNGLIAFHNDKNKLLLCHLIDRVMIHIPTVRRPSYKEHFELGFDTSIKKYKILVWMEDKDTDYCLSDVHIRTLEKDSPWRPIKETPQFRSLGAKPQVNVNRTLFWLDTDEERIISFDLADETFRITQLPGEINLKAFEHTMFEFEGCLGLVELPSPDDEQRSHFEIINFWILKDVVSHQWISMLKNKFIPVDGTNLRNYYMFEEYAPVADFSARNGELLIAAADGDHQYLFLYSFLNDEFKRITITGLGMQHISVRNHVENHVNIEEFGERVYLYNQ